MALLTKRNLALYKKYVDDLSTQIASLSSYLKTARELINDETGSSFRQNYDIGLKATTNINNIIDILDSLKGDLEVIKADAVAFWNTSNSASSK